MSYEQVLTVNINLIKGLILTINYYIVNIVALNMDLIGSGFIDA